MKRRILLVLGLCLLLTGLVGCSKTTRGFLTGIAVGAAAATVWCADCSHYVETCCHCRH